jgi:hypothetical protein
MAGRGPAPKPDAERRRRNKPASPSVVVSGDDVTRGPDLPGSYDWPAPTREWWETWRASPQASTFTDTDWGFLLDTALLHGELWAGNAAVASELRLRVAKFGATPEDRQRLRMSIETPETSVSKPKTARYGHLKVIGE